MMQKKLGVISFFLLVLLIPISSAAARDGYLLISYYEFTEGSPAPGDTITIKTELYKSNNRITESVEIKIEYISGLSGITTPIPMIDNGAGIFSYMLTIPLETSASAFYINFNAYIDGVSVDSDSLTIILSTEEEDGVTGPLNSISHLTPKPGETVEVLTYIPSVADGQIDASEPIITVGFAVYGSIRDNSEKTSINIGNGFYSASYTIPTGFSVNAESSAPRLSVSIVANYSGQEFWDGYYLNIGGLRVFTKSSLLGSSFILDVLVLGEDYQPVEDAIVNTTITRLRENAPSDSFSTILPNTNSEGRSTYTTTFDTANLRSIDIEVIIKKDDRFGMDSTYINLESDYSYDYFSINPDSDYIKDLLLNYDKGVYLNMIAMKGREKLKNTQLEVYAHWDQGMIETFLATTDENGLFRLEVDWPEEMKSQYIEIDFIYFNGTKWFYYEFMVSKIPENVKVNSGPSPKISFIDYDDYYTAAISYQIPSTAPVGTIYSTVIYEEVSIFSISLQGQELFIDTSGIIGNSFKKPIDGKINTHNVIDKAATLKYLVIIIQYPAENVEDGMEFIIWLIDSKGKTVGVSSQTYPELTGFDTLALGLILLSMITISLLKRKK